MEKIDVYFDHRTMYNLEDMSILSELPKESTKALYEHLSMVQEDYTIEMAVMGLNHPLRNALYTVFPDVMVIINPQDVQAMIEGYLITTQSLGEAQGEMAAAMEDHVGAPKEIGCQGIYDHATKQEAISYYKQWQGDVPLGVKSFYHIISTMDYYYEEIFNYFDFPNIIRGKHYKIRHR